MRPTFTLINPTIRPVGVELLKKHATVEMSQSGAEADLISHMNRYSSDAIITRGQQITRRMMEAVPSLKVVGLPGVGVDCIDVEAASDIGVLVMHAPRINYKSVAEHAIGAMLAIAKNFVAGDRAVRSGDFQYRDRNYPNEMIGKTVFIIGLGRIGTQVAKVCREFLEMKVLACDPIYDAAQMAQKGATKVGMDEGLAAADVVTVHVPLTEETRGFINAAAFAKMRPGTIFINTARGPVTRTADLVAALQSGHLRGAGIDVFDPEPPTKDDPLLKLSNVILTPHFAGDTIEAKDRAATTICQGMLDALFGRPCETIVNPEVLSHSKYRLASPFKPETAR